MLEYCASTQETASVGARARPSHAAAGLALEAAAGTSHAAKKTSLPPVQSPFKGHIPNHNQRGAARARRKLKCFVSSPETPRTPNMRVCSAYATKYSPE